MLLSIVVPCYNEGKTVVEAMEKLKEYLNPIYCDDYEVIFVNDGSTDDTISYMEKVAEDNKEKCGFVSYSKNRGKGYAVRQGLEVSRGDYVFYLDADMAVELAFVPLAMSYLEKDADMVMASRRHPDSSTNEKKNFVRNIVSKGCVFCTKALLPGVSFSDTQCGGKGFKRKTVETILPELKVDGFSFDIEIITKCLKNKFHIQEVPIVWNNREKGSKVSVVKDSIKFFGDLVKIRKEMKG